MRVTAAALSHEARLLESLPFPYASASPGVTTARWIEAEQRRDAAGQLIGAAQVDQAHKHFRQKVLGHSHQRRVRLAVQEKGSVTVRLPHWLRSPCLQLLPLRARSHIFTRRHMLPPTATPIFIPVRIGT